jgi:hypothetical protein
LLDWDDLDEIGGEANLELLAWTPTQLKRYSLTGSVWSVQTLINFASPISGVELLDVDGDGAQELLSYGADGLKAWSASGGGSPVHSELLPSLSPVEALVVTDIDGDGDEDLLMRSGAELWQALANGSAAHPNEHSAVSLEFVNGANPQTSRGVRILIDEDGNFSFERSLSARSFGDTLLSFGGAGTVNLQVIFPDRGEPGGNQVALTGVVKGSLYSVTDPQ